MMHGQDAGASGPSCIATSGTEREREREMFAIERASPMYMLSWECRLGENIRVRNGGIALHHFISCVFSFFFSMGLDSGANTPFGDPNMPFS